MKTLKNIGRKYIAPIALAGALILGSYGCVDKSELPINPEVRKTIITEQNQEFEAKQTQANSKLDKMANTYWSKLDSTENQFNKYLAQRDTLTVGEQENLLGSYRFARDLRWKIYRFSKSEGISNSSPLAFPKNHSKLYRLLDSNLNKIDLGITELEKELRNSGVNVDVQTKMTFSDKLLLGFMSGVLFPSVLFGSLYTMARRTKK